MRAVVLSGGGSKGAYEIGVWKALRKLHISYDIVTGTSVGALNATLMVQKDYIKALLLWYNLNSSMVYDSNMDIKSNKDFVKYAKKIVSDGGLDIGNLERTIDKYVNIKKVYNSKIDLGIVTVEYPSLKSVELVKSEIPQSKFKDYIVASASCFPAFQKKTIDGKEYIDGGFYDNMPINLAISMGADEVIAVDLDAIGINRRVKNKDVPVTIISPKTDTGSFLVFDKVSARRAIRLGYHDTLKVYNKLDGNIYSFKKGVLRKHYFKYKSKFIDLFHSFMNIEDQGLISKIASLSIYEKIFSFKDDDVFYKKFNEIIEKVGLIFSVDDSYVYSMEKYHSQLFSKLEEISKDSFEDIYSERHNSKIKRLFKDELMVSYLYYYLLENSDISEISEFILIFPNAFLSALYLYMIYNR